MVGGDYNNVETVDDWCADIGSRFLHLSKMHGIDFDCGFKSGCLAYSVLWPSFRLFAVLSGFSSSSGPLAREIGQILS